MIKILSLFSGIGAFEKALENLEIDYDLVGYCEIDKYASKSFAAIHGVSEEKNFGDITKIDETTLPKDIDLITYGFPCQDISVAGKLKGFKDEDGNTTRSGLFFEALRLIEGTKPKIAIAENVKNLTGSRFKNEFEIVLNSLENAGYNNYWKVLNAKDYGIPQNRERVFIVSIRKDIDHGLFEFPKAYPLKKRLKDLLEPEVDEKYYLSDEQMEKISLWKAHQRPLERVLGKESLSPTLTARGAGENHSGMVIYSEELNETTNLDAQIKINVVGNYSPSNHDASRIVNADGLAPTVKENHGTVTAVVEPVIAASRGRNPNNPSDRRKGIPTKQRLEIKNDGTTNTLTTVQKDNYVIVPEATKKGYAEASEGDSINLEYPNSKTRRGRVGHGIAQTLTRSCNQAVVTKPTESSDE